MYPSDQRTFTIQTVPSWKLVKPIRTEATERTRTTNMAAISDNGGQGKGIAEGLTQGGTEAHLTPNYYSDLTLIFRLDPRNSPLLFPLYVLCSFFFLSICIRRMSFSVYCKKNMLQNRGGSSFYCQDSSINKSCK